MWVTKLLISPVKKRIFCPKTTKFGPKLAFFVNLGQAMQASSVPSYWVGWWLWRAGCISQDTYLLYVYIVVLHLFSCLCFVLVESCVNYHSVLLPLFCCPWLCYKLIVHPSVLPPLDSSPTLNLSRLSSLTHNYDR